MAVGALPHRPRWSVAVAWVAAVAFVPVAWSIWPLFPDAFGAVDTAGRRTFATAVYLAPAFLWVACGLVVHVRRPDQRTGAVMLLVGWLDAAGFALFWSATTPGVFVAGLLAYVTAWPLVPYLLLAYPDGRLHGRVDRAIVAAWVAYVVVRGLAWFLFVPGYPGVHPDGVNPLQVWDRPDIGARVFDTAAYAFGVANAVVIESVFVARLVRSSPARRRVLAPLAVTVLVWYAAEAVFHVAVLAVHVRHELLGRALLGDVLARPVWAVVRGLRDAAFVLAPLAFLLGLEIARRRRRRLFELVVGDETASRTASLRDALRHVVGDPLLEVGFPVGDGAAVVDEHGAEVTLPPPDDPQRAVTQLGGDATRLGVVVHDRVLASDPRFLAAVAAAARLALAARRLDAEVEARAEAIAASQHAAAAAAEAERRRIGRDLHDGAQQRLANLALLLTLTESTVDSPEGVETLRALREEVDAAIAEVRDLARGLAPPVLVREGLAGALRSLAARSPVVDVAATLDEPVPDAVALAGWFVASEGVANALKHASATRIAVSAVTAGDVLRVEVVDDGRGGADRHGAGLRGVDERVRALGGELMIATVLGGGTTLAAALPLRTGVVMAAERPR